MTADKTVSKPYKKGVKEVFSIVFLEISSEEVGVARELIEEVILVIISNYR